MGIYLSATDAEARLMAAGHEPLSEAQLEAVLSDIDALIESWLGYSAPVQEYIQRLKTNRKGVGRMEHYPVVAVTEVAVFNNHDARTDPTPVPAEHINSIWQQTQVLYTPYSNAPLKVTYQAGYDPLPAAFKQAAIAVLLKAAAQGAISAGLDLQSLASTSTQELKAVTLPEGLKEEYYQSANNSGSGLKGQGDLVEALIDQILKPHLWKYRREYAYA